MEPVFIIKFHYLVAYNIRFSFFVVRCSVKTHNVGYFLFQLIIVSAIHVPKRMTNNAHNTVPISQVETHLSDIVSIMFINLDWAIIQIMSRLTFVMRLIHLNLLVAFIYYVFFKPVHMFKDTVCIKR